MIRTLFRFSYLRRSPESKFSLTLLLNLTLMEICLFVLNSLLNVLKIMKFVKVSNEFTIQLTDIDEKEINYFCILLFLLEGLRKICGVMISLNVRIIKLIYYFLSFIYCVDKKNFVGFYSCW